MSPQEARLIADLIMMVRVGLEGLQDVYGRQAGGRNLSDTDVADLRAKYLESDMMLDETTRE